MTLDSVAARWCLLRLPSNLEAPTGDVDLLIDPTSIRSAREALELAGFIEVSVGGGVECVYVNYDAASDVWIRLHIVTTIAFGANYVIHPDLDRECLDRRRRMGPLSILADEDCFWVTLLHCLLEKGRIAAHHHRRLQEFAAASPRGFFRDWTATVCPVGWTTDALVNAIQQGAFDKFEQTASAWQSAAARKAGIGARLAGYFRSLLRVPMRMWNRLRRPGMTVAILGPDGAGKTTLADGINQTFFCSVTKFYMGFGVSGGATPLLARLPIPIIGAAGRLLTLWWQFLRAWLAKRRGYLVLFDRYTYDGFAPPPGKRGWFSRFSTWLKARSCPAPDFVIVLDVPGEVMFERKGDLSPEILEAQRQKFLTLKDRIPDLLVVDATHDAETVRREVTEFLWQRYQARWRRR